MVSGPNDILLENIVTPTTGMNDTLKFTVVNNTNIFAFIYLVWNVVFIPRCFVQAVRDDLSAKTVPIWLHHTVRAWLKHRSSHGDLCTNKQNLSDKRKEGAGRGVINLTLSITKKCILDSAELTAIYTCVWSIRLPVEERCLAYGPHIKLNNTPYTECYYTWILYIEYPGNSSRVTKNSWTFPL